MQPPPVREPRKEDRAASAPEPKPSEPVKIPLDKFATCYGCDDMYTRASDEPCATCFNATKHSKIRNAKTAGQKGFYHKNPIPGVQCPTCQGETHIYEFPNGSQRNSCKKCRKFI